MANLKEIRARVASIKNTQQITKAMKMVSAAKLRRAQEKIENMRPYARELLGVIADIAVTQRVSHPLLERKEKVNQVLYVVVTSDRGLCGGFNSNVNKFVERYISENKSRYEKMDFIFVGRKGSDYMKRRGVNGVETILNLAREVSVPLATRIATKLMDAYQAGGHDEIRFIYNEFKSAIAQNLTSETILPVDLSCSSLAQDGGKTYAPDLIFEPAPALMVDQLLQKHFAIQVYRCLCESVAAEHAARMTAMENATNNAKDMIESMTLEMNKLRQATITTELIEITSGAEALKG